MPLTSILRYFYAFFKEFLTGYPAKGADNFGLNNADLPFQKGETCLDLVSFGVPILGRMAFYYVADVYIPPGQSHSLFDDIGQQFSGLTNKRPSYPVFVLARTFADKYKSGPGRPLSKNQIFSALVEFASAAIAYMGPQRFKGTRLIGLSGMNWALRCFCVQFVQCPLWNGRGFKTHVPISLYHVFQLTKDVFNFRFRIQVVNCPAYKIDMAAPEE
jgi:hypothetical protein